MVLPDRMRAVLPLERELLKASAPPMLFRVQSGITIHELNDALAQAGLGLLNMGGYDGQTIAGAISMLAQFGMFFGGGHRDNSGNSGLGVIGTLAMVILAPLAATLVAGA